MVLNMKVNKNILLGIVIGAVCYFALFDIKTLDPSYIEWYIQKGDRGQHILGFLAYINSSFYFPYLLTDFIFYPEKISIVYTDSLPLISFILKPIGKIAGYFQYFGIYGLFNFIMQGICAAIIIGRWTNNKILLAVFTTMIVLTPVFIVRLYGHHALSSHWIILLSIAYILNNYESPNNIRKDMIFWNCMFFIIPGIHFYFFPMVYGLAFMYIMYKYYRDKKYFILQIFTHFAVTFTTLFIYGYFYNLEAAGTSGVGHYVSNLNTFINRANIGSILPGMPILSGQYEGIGYLGLGFIILVLFAFIIMIYKKLNHRTAIKNRKLFYYILITFAVFLFVSFGGKISFNNHILCNIDLSKLLSTFRSSGRFIWVCVYIINFVSIYYILTNIKTNKGKSAVLFIAAVIFIVQIIDIYPFLKNKSNQINSMVSNNTNLMMFNDEQCKYLKDNFEFVHINSKGSGNYSVFYPHIYSFFRCGIPINNFYTARKLLKSVRQAKDKLIYQNIADGKLDDKILVLNAEANKIDMKNIHVHKLNGVLLLANKQIPFLEDVSEDFISKKINLQ